jgi:hypothetical protein
MKQSLSSGKRITESGVREIFGLGNPFLLLSGLLILLVFLPLLLQ